MNSKYKLTVNETYKFEISEEDLSKIDLIKTSNTKYHLLDENHSTKVELVEANFQRKKYTVLVNSNLYKVSIANDLDQRIETMGFSFGSTKHINRIIAPMPGLILDINVAEGEEVNEDDPLLILEAMKMENVITSPRPGTIKSISVAIGEAVEKNQLLIEFE